MTRQAPQKLLLTRTAIAGLVIFSLPTLANADIPDPVPELQRQDRELQELRQRAEGPLWSPSGVLLQTPPAQRLPTEAPCVKVNRISLQTQLGTAPLIEALSGVKSDDPPYGRCLGSQGITILVQRLQQALVQQGYVTSQAYVPEQDLNTGDLVLQVLEGRLAQIRLAPNTSESALNKGQLAHNVWAVQEGHILNLRDVEQSSDNLQRLPSLQSSLQIVPGAEVGTSDLVLTLRHKRPLRLALSLNDAGQKTHGVAQSQATLSWDNPLGLGDLFYYNHGLNLGRKEPGPRGSYSHTLHYSVPWGYWLLSATASQSRSHQTEFGPFQSYLYRGHSQQQEVSLARVLHRSGQSKTTATINHVQRESRNFIDDLEVFVQRRSARGWDLGLQHIHYLPAGTLVASLGAKHMRETLGAAEGTLPQQHTSGRLRSVGLSWTMPWHMGKQPWQYAAQWNRQWAQSPLAAQERFCLGGRSTVRGFNGRQTWCGDHGQLIRQEISTRITSPTWVVQQLQGYAALDHGRAYASGQPKDTLQGVTLGLRGLDALPNDSTLQWDVFVAQSTRRPIGATHTKPVSGFTLRALF